MSPGSRMPDAWSASLRPDAGEAVGLQLEPHRELVAPRPRRRAGASRARGRRYRAGSARGGRPRARRRRRTAKSPPALSLRSPSRRRRSCRGRRPRRAGSRTARPPDSATPQPLSTRFAEQDQRRLLVLRRPSPRTAGSRASSVSASIDGRRSARHLAFLGRLRRTARSSSPRGALPAPCSIGVGSPPRNMTSSAIASVPRPPPTSPPRLTRMPRRSSMLSLCRRPSQRMVVSLS